MRAESSSIFEPDLSAGQQRTEPTRDAVLVFSAHNWRACRQGGIHKLAEGMCRLGYDVDFVSFPRPLYGLIRRHELSNPRALVSLARGRRFDVYGSTLFNFTCPTFALPRAARRWCGARCFEWLETTSLPSWAGRIRRRRRTYRAALFESAPCVRLYAKVRRLLKSTTVAYRASDPIPHASAEGPEQEAERLLLKEADVVLLINEASRDLYARAYPEIDVSDPRFQVLPNGVDLAPFRRPWPRPAAYGDRPIAAYVGIAPVDWELILACADRFGGVDFHIVLPDARLDARLKQRIRSRANVLHCPGIPPDEVPRWVTNCDVSIVPYAEGSYLHVARLHGKLLQAMAARRPIVAINLTAELEEHGLAVAADHEDFQRKLGQALDGGPKDYPVDLDALDWQHIQAAVADRLGLSDVNHGT